VAEHSLHCLDVGASQNLVQELARSIYNAESSLLLNGTVGANGFAGINQVTGTLTRAAAIGTTDYDALDVLSKAFVDLRADYFVPDLVIIHPASLGAIRRLRDVNKRLKLEMIEGPRRIDQTSEQETLWGVAVIQTTQQAAGTAAVLSVASGAAVVYVREALSTFFDPYSQASSNIYQYIAETRLALASPRPQAINLVTGLPTS
jgi:HK97 family phage major capsid protein